MYDLIGRGARVRGENPKKKGETRKLAFPSLLRVSLSRSPFRDPLSPKGVSLVLWRKVCAKSSVHSRYSSSERLKSSKQLTPSEWLTPSERLTPSESLTP